MQIKDRTWEGTHHGAPEVPIAQRSALLVTVFEGEDDQDQVASNALEVAFDCVPDGLVEGVQWRIAHPTGATSP